LQLRIIFKQLLTSPGRLSAWPGQLFCCNVAESGNHVNQLVQRQSSTLGKPRFCQYPINESAITEYAVIVTVIILK
jgi:hypothetical protein